LNKYYPGHRIPYQVVSGFVKEYPTCQKNRLEMNDDIKPLVKHLKSEHHCKIIGVDHLSITPNDRFGNSGGGLLFKAYCFTPFS
jgi:hypothetical protein